MIEKDGEGLIATCDECGKKTFCDPIDFYEFVGTLMRGGWRFAKVDGVGKHYCPQCLGPKN